MRTIRFLTGLLALALLGLTPLALSPSASADSARAVAATSAPAAERAKLPRTLGDNFKQKANGSYVIYGKASPEGGNKTIKFKKKDCKKCAWKFFKKIKTKSNGKWEIKMVFPRSSKPTWYFKGLMKGGQKYKTARTQVYLTCRRVVC